MKAVMRPAAVLFLLLSCLPAATLYASGQPEAERARDGDPVDYLGVAAVMLRDGQWDRAEAALAHVDPSTKGVDEGRFYALRGALRLQLSLPEEAAADLEKAVRAGNRDPSVALALAHACHDCGRYAEALATIGLAPGMPQSPGRLSLEAACLWELDHVEEALAVLGKAVELFPASVPLRRQAVSCLLALGLTQEAALQARALCDAAGADPEAHLLYAEALRRTGGRRETVLALEEARLRFPGDARFTISLARAYAQEGKQGSAADLGEQAAAMDPRYCLEAAGMAREAGRTEGALRLIALAAEGPERTRQRFLILVEGGFFEEAVSLQAALEETGAFADAGLLYAMAYARFRTGGYGEARALLDRIPEASYSGKAALLSEAVRRAGF